MIFKVTAALISGFHSYCMKEFIGAVLYEQQLASMTRLGDDSLKLFNLFSSIWETSVLKRFREDVDSSKFPNFGSSNGFQCPRSPAKRKDLKVNLQEKLVSSCLQL